MLSIPLRRALVVNSKLPYPEGCAAAEVIRVLTTFVRKCSVRL
jgi:uncharacterized oligopeptide transporter (OPT) family protein